MEQTQTNQVRRRAGRLFPTSYRGWATLLVTWVLTWTILFSGLDFWTLKLYDVSHYHWFETYRSAVRYSATIISPASFAFAENAYFIWMNMYDRDYGMHEWAWYTGDPVNPDGYYNFVWGNGRGGWMRFPMKEWYGVWLLITLVWLSIVSLVFVKWRQRVGRKQARGRPGRDSSLQSA